MAQKPTAPDKKDKNKGKGSSVGGKNPLSADLQLIRNAAAIFATTLVVSGSMIYFSDDFMLQKQGQLNITIQQREEAQQKLSRAREEEQEIREYLGLYQHLEKQNIVGDEKRLDHIEALQQVYEKHKLAPITYEIFPQQTVQLDASVKTAEMELRATSAKLTLDLLHEGDLLTLLSALKQNASDFFSAQNCRIQRRQLSTAETEHKLENRLTAECTINWLTIGARQKAPDGENAETPPPEAQ